MHRTSASVRAAGRLPGSSGEGEAELEPAWRPWHRLLALALEAADDPAWAAAVPRPDAARPPDAPLLRGTIVRVDGRRARRLTRKLLRAAADGDGAGASLAGLRSRRLDTLELLRAGLAADAEAIGRIAAGAGGEAAVDAGALGVVAQLAAMPLLHACATRLSEQVPDVWLRGYCPICGAWPTLAELRGIERNRHLRCGRCGGDWVMPVLRCPFCDEVRHDHLASLVPEGEEQRRRVDTCESCKGYLKTLTTLRPLPLRSLALEDLGTVEFDLIAQERGYARPERPGYPLAITIERAPRDPALGPRPSPAGSGSGQDDELSRRAEGR